MRILSVAVLYFISNIACAQKSVKIDSVYYLLDTSKTPVKDRMWDINRTTSYRYFTLNCPCLNIAGKPVFSNEIRDNGKIISGNMFKTLKLTSITELIGISKKFLDEGDLSGQHAFFIVEPRGKRYIVYQVMLMNSKIKMVSLPDVIQAKPDTSAFATKGVKKIKADDVKSHLNEVIVTNGNCVDAKIDDDASVMLFVNGYNSTVGFVILIKKTDRNNFDLPELHYKGKAIKVIGKVIDYKGLPVINITNENQILVMD